MGGLHISMGLESAILLVIYYPGMRLAMQEGRLLNKGVRRKLLKRAQRKAAAAKPAAKPAFVVRQSATAQASSSNFEVPLDIYCIKLVVAHIQAAGRQAISRSQHQS